VPRPVPSAAGAYLALIVAILAGSALGLFGARRNGVRFADERLLWALGGGLGVGIEWQVGASLGGSLGAAVGSLSWAAGSLLAAWWSPRLDAARSRAAHLASILIKTSQCPLSTGTALLASIALAGGRPRWRLRGGACYAEAGEGRSAVALGGVVLAQDGRGNPFERTAYALGRAEDETPSA
jgi:hypothetical protein